MEQPGDFRLLIRPVPHARPLATRLRHVLKGLLRAYGFRVVSVEELPSGPTAASAAGTTAGEARPPAAPGHSSDPGAVPSV